MAQNSRDAQRRVDSQPRIGICECFIWLKTWKHNHVASACILMHESTLLYLTPFGYLNCLNRTGHLRTYKYTAAQSTTQCLQITQKYMHFNMTCHKSSCTSQAQSMRGVQHPSPPSQRWNKSLNEIEAFFLQIAS